MMRIRFLLPLMALMGACLLHDATAALVLVERFSYAPNNAKIDGVVPNGQGEATNAWVTANGDAQNKVQNTSLSFPRHLGTTGRKLSVSTNGNRSHVLFDMPGSFGAYSSDGTNVNQGVLWLSFTTRFDVSGSTTSTPIFSALELTSSGGDVGTSPGVTSVRFFRSAAPYGASDFIGTDAQVNGAQVGSSSCDVDPVANVNYLVLARIDLDNDTLVTWCNPGDVINTNAPDRTQSIAGVEFSAMNFFMSQTNGNSTRTFFDEVRIGSALSDVANVTLVPDGLIWDADTGVASAQDGGGAWSMQAGDTNWWNGSANTNWSNTAPGVAIIGAGSGSAGTITLAESVTVDTLILDNPGSGSYTVDATSFDLVVNDELKADADCAIQGSGGYVPDGSSTITVGPEKTLSMGMEIVGLQSLTKSGRGTLVLETANTGTTFTVNQGYLVSRANGSFGPTNVVLANTDAGLEVGAGLSISNALVVSNDGNGKDLRLQSGTANSGEYAGTILIEEGLSGNFRVRPNSTAGDWDYNQVLTLSGKISTGSALIAGEVAMDHQSDGVLQLTNPSNDFAGDIRLDNGGSTLRVPADAPLSDAQLIINQGNTKVMLVDGVTVDNELLATDNAGRKVLMLEPGGSIEATYSGPITVDEVSHGNFELDVLGTSVNNDTSQVLTVSGPMTSTAGAGVEIRGDGVVVLSNPSNDITGRISLTFNGSTLRIDDAGALGSSGSNQVRLDNANTYLELADGLTVGTNTTLEIMNENGNHGIRVYNANNAIAESATFVGDIECHEGHTQQGRAVAAVDDTLTLTGVISGTRFSNAGDGTIVFDGSVSNTFANGYSLGDNGVCTWDGTSGNKNGFAVVKHPGALGTSIVLARGSQLVAGVPDIVIPNDIKIDTPDLRLGGTNDFTMSGNLTWQPGDSIGLRQIGHYGLEGATYTFDGDITIQTNSTLQIIGPDGKDNGTLVFNGVISGANDAGVFEVDHTFEDCDIYLNGTNTFNGKMRFEQGTIHLYQEANLGGNPTAFDADALDLGVNEPVTLHITETFAIDDPNRGVKIGASGDVFFDVDPGKTLTIGSSNVIYSTGGAGRFVKEGDGTLVLQAANTYSNDTVVAAGTLAVAGGSALPDDFDLTVTGATLRLDDSETVGPLVLEGTLSLNGNTLTLPAGADHRIDGSAPGSGTLIVGDGATLVGEVDAPAATVVLGSSAGVTLSIDGSTTNALTAGTLNVSGGTQTVVLAYAPTNTAETVTVANYGTLVGGLGNLQLQNAAGYRSAVLATNGSAVTLTIGNQVHAWDNASGNRRWDIGTSVNWTSTDSVFHDGDTVTFGDTGVGAVTLMSDVGPGPVTFNNPLGSDYTFAGNSGGETLSCAGELRVSGGGDVTISNIIGGVAGIMHSGSGVLTLGGVNTFTGGITVKPGAKLKAGNNQAFGATTQSHVLTVESGGTLDTGGHDFDEPYGAGSIVVSGAGVDGKGAIVNYTRDNTQTFDDELLLAGDTTFGGTKRWDIRGAGFETSVNDITITKEGTGRIALVSDNRSASVAQWIINEGTIQIENNGALAHGVVTLNSGGELSSWNNRTVQNHIRLNGGRVFVWNDTTMTYAGPMSVDGDSTLDPNGAAKAIVVSGALSGTNQISVGNGLVRLSGDTSGFTGAMNMSEAGGILAVDGTAHTFVSFSAIAGTTVENGNAAAGSLALGSDNADTTLPCVLRDGTGGGSLNLVKTGTGTLAFTAVNTHTGTTDVDAGTLLLPADSTNATGAVTVQSGALLGGAGSVGGAVTLAAGAGLNVELNDTDTTLDCATLTVNDLDIDDCVFSVAGGYAPGGDYVLVNADVPVVGSVAPGIRSLPGNVQGLLAIDGNQLILRTIPGATLLLVR